MGDCFELLKKIYSDLGQQLNIFSISSVSANKYKRDLLESLNMVTFIYDKAHRNEYKCCVFGDECRSFK